MGRAGIAALALALAIGCGAPDSDLERLDVGTLFGSSVVWSDTRQIDFGTESAAPYLLEGWSGDEGEFAWAVGNRSSLRFFVGSPGPRVLVARVTPLNWPGAPPQSMTLSIDGRRFAHEVLEPRLQEFRWELPADLVPPGLRRLDVEYGRADRASSVIEGSRDARRLAVAWHELRIEGAGAAPPPAVADRNGRPVLRMGRGTQVDLYAAVGSPAFLEAAALEDGSAAPPVIHATVEGDRTGRVWEGSFGAASADRIPLGVDGTDVLRVRVQVPSDGDGRAAGAPVDVSLSLLGRSVRAAATPAPAPDDGPPAPPSAPAAKPNVLIFLVDCLRADHLGTYGYPRPTSPNIDAFAAGATVFLDAQAASSWTRTTVASVFTGLMPSAHGVENPEDALAPERTTLAEQLLADGYQTAAVFTNGNIAPEFGLGQGFETYLHLKEDVRRPEVHIAADEVVANARAWLDRRDPAKPFFLYLHATDPHGPYTPREPFASRFAPHATDPALRTLALLSGLGAARFPEPERFRQPLIDLYDGEIAFTDAHFGRLIEDLRERGVLDDTLVVLMADHGEEFYDHGWWEHGKTLFVEQLHVPLVMRFPRGAGAGLRVEAPVHQIDVLPTILAAAGVTPAVPGGGVDLAGLAGRNAAAPSRSLRAELDRDGRRINALLAERWKLISYRSGQATDPEGRTPRSLLFDRVEDPREQRNLYLERPVLAGFFRLSLDGTLAALAPTPAAPAAQVDRATEESLRALGYVE